FFALGLPSAPPSAASDSASALLSAASASASASVFSCSSIRRHFFSLVRRSNSSPFCRQPYDHSERYQDHGLRTEATNLRPLPMSSGVGTLCLPSFSPPSSLRRRPLMWVEPVFCSSTKTSFSEISIRSPWQTRPAAPVPEKPPSI